MSRKLVTITTCVSEDPGWEKGGKKTLAIFPETVLASWTEATGVKTPRVEAPHFIGGGGGVTHRFEIPWTLPKEQAPRDDSSGAPPTQS